MDGVEPNIAANLRELADALEKAVGRSYLTLLVHEVGVGSGTLVVEHGTFAEAEDYLFKWRSSPGVQDIHILAHTPTPRGGFWDCPMSTTYERRRGVK